MITKSVTIWGHLFQYGQSRGTFFEDYNPWFALEGKKARSRPTAGYVASMSVALLGLGVFQVSVVNSSSQLPCQQSNPCRLVICNLPFYERSLNPFQGNMASYFRLCRLCDGPCVQV